MDRRQDDRRATIEQGDRPGRPWMGREREDSSPKKTDQESCLHSRPVEQDPLTDKNEESPPVNEKHTLET